MCDVVLLSVWFFLRIAKYKCCCCCCCRGLWASVISFSFKKAGSLCSILKEIRKEAMNYLSLAFSEFEQLCHFGVISLRNYLILLDRSSGLVPAGSWWHYQFNKNGATLTAICCFSIYDKSKMLALKTHPKKKKNPFNCTHLDEDGDECICPLKWYFKIKDTWNC